VSTILVARGSKPLSGIDHILVCLAYMRKCLCRAFCHRSLVRGIKLGHPEGWCGPLCRQGLITYFRRRIGHKLKVADMCRYKIIQKPSFRNCRILCISPFSCLISYSTILPTSSWCNQTVMAPKILVVLTSVDKFPSLEQPTGWFLVRSTHGSGGISAYE
jgi:hypothetical protein